MLKLGRVSKETRGAVIAGWVEDIFLQNPGSNFPKT
jgi:hypothetical protein